MIIIKIIILYFIQIRHTDDFPSTGTHLVIIINIIILYFKHIAHTDDFPLKVYPASDNNNDFI